MKLLQKRALNFKLLNKTKNTLRLYSYIYDLGSNPVMSFSSMVKKYKGILETELLCRLEPCQIQMNNRSEQTTTNIDLISQTSAQNFHWL